MVWWTRGLVPARARARRVRIGDVLSMGAHFLCGFRISFQELTLRERELLDQFVNVVFRTHLDHLRFIWSLRGSRPMAESALVVTSTVWAED